MAGSHETSAAVESFTLSVISGPRSTAYRKTGSLFLLRRALAERFDRACEQIVRLGAVLGQLFVRHLEARGIAAQARAGHAAQCRLLLLAGLEPQSEGLGNS